MESGAKAAISGYRLQALYTLDLILHDASSNNAFQPEGHEDLAVFVDNRLVKAVQVKAHSSPLALSRLSLGREDPAFRLLTTPADDPILVEVASFGPLGPELEAVQRGDPDALNTLLAKLIGYGYSQEEAKRAASRLRIVTVTEGLIRERVHRHLSLTFAAGDPERALDLLTWWILKAAENRYRITFSDLRDRLTVIGKYIAERQAHHDEWFTTVKPLTALSVTDPQALAADYYRGVSARYDHIIADLDVRRETHLTAIHDHYRGNRRVVIIHGASGQGKTSLALRYLHEYVPDDWRFIVTAIDDRRHASKIANALSDHLAAVDALAYVLIDVAPTDRDWVTLVRDLLQIPNVRILVAIRDEDLARRTAGESELGLPGDVRLEFDEVEAVLVYEKLVTKTDSLNAFPTFREAWQRFGTTGPLLEFVYLITQTESLRSVLASQLRRLRAEVQSGFLEPSALRFLHICALANSFEAHINLRPLVESLQLADPAGIVALFENEYLLRVSPDRTKIEGLHAVRSRILAEELGDPALSPAEEIAIDCLPFIPEEDLEVFLLHLLSRLPTAWTALPSALMAVITQTWKGAAGIGRALWWWGIKQYLEENREAIRKARESGGDAWAMLLLPDLAGALDSDPAHALLEIMERVNPERAHDLRRLRATLTPREQALEPLRAWLRHLATPASPTDAADWEGFAELRFWAGRFGIAMPTDFDLSALSAESVPANLASRVCLALAQGDPSGAELPDSLSKELRRRFREETMTLILTEGDTSVTAEFLVAFDSVLEREPAGGASIAEDPSSGAGDGNADRGTESLSGRLNEEAVRRVAMLKGLFPHKEIFCSQGHGHVLRDVGIELPHDDTLKRMPTTAVLAPWLVRTNATLHSLELFQHRPATWRAYAAALLEVRELTANTLLHLTRSLTAYFEGNRARSLFGDTLPQQMWQEAQQAVAQSFRLPKSAVDEWGLSSETQSGKPDKSPNSSANLASTFALRQHAASGKALGDFAASVSNFLTQAEIVCAVNGMIGRDPTRRQSILLQAEGYGYSDNKVRLSKFNLFQAMLHLEPMQTAFDDRVSQLVDPVRLARVKKRETELFPDLWALWYEFCTNPERRMRAASIEARSSMERSLDSLRKALHSNALSSPDWTLTILSERVPWQGRKALALRLDIGSIDAFEFARAESWARLSEVFSSARNGSLEQYSLDFHWSFVLVIPTLSGAAPERRCWAIPSFALHPGDAAADLEKPWLKAMHALSDEQLKELTSGIRWPTRADHIAEIEERFGSLVARYAHLATLEPLLERLDELGTALLAGYVADVDTTLEREVDRLRWLISHTALGAMPNEQAPSEVRDVLLEPLARFAEERREARPSSLAPRLRDCAAQVTKFRELVAHLVILRWLGTLAS